MSDKEKKEALQKRLRRRNGVWNEAVKYYLLKVKHAKQRAELLTGQLIRQAFSNEQSPIDVSIHLCHPGRSETISQEPAYQFRKKALNNIYLASPPLAQAFTLPMLKLSSQETTYRMPASEEGSH